MRHGKKFNHLGRKAAHRKAMLSNMACSLIKHKRIKTTLAKAKALRIYVEPLLTKSKKDTTHSRRIVFSYLKQKEVVNELFGEISVKIAERPGGYTRILKLSNRLGDNAQMAYIELVDYNDEYTTEKTKRKKSRRARKKTVDLGVSDNEKDLDSSKEVPTEEAHVEEVAAEEAPAEEVPAEEVPAEEVPAEEVAAEEAPVEEVAAEETPAEEAPVEEVPAEEPPVEENLEDQDPKKEE